MTIFCIEKTCMRLFKSFKTLVESTTVQQNDICNVIIYINWLLSKPKNWTRRFFLCFYVVCNIINFKLLCTASFYDTLICLSNGKKDCVLSSTCHHVTQRWNTRCNVSVLVYRLKPKTNVGFFYPRWPNILTFQCFHFLNDIFALLFSILNV